VLLVGRVAVSGAHVDALAGLAHILPVEVKVKVQLLRFQK
jgi:hypothetical protein